MSCFEYYLFFSVTQELHFLSSPIMIVSGMSSFNLFSLWF